MEPTEISRGYCHVCGNGTIFRSYEPIDFPCKRNSFICDECGSSARNRHIAKTVLELYPEIDASSLREFSTRFEGSIFIPATTGAIPNALSACEGLVMSEFIDGVDAGELKDGILCQDIQATSFCDDCFDLVITEDVLEHVPFPRAAFAEIRRILKPGGHHVATIPMKRKLKKSMPRATLENGEIKHLLEPEYHLDPTRPEGILAFTDFGQDLVKEYCSITGPSKMLEAHKDVDMERNYAIYNNWVYLSRKRHSLKSFIAKIAKAS